ncbi:AraC family transcriptional regulator [Pseudorhodoferax sp. Leaf267]|uniref:AraC family transcriptional regulator n=1 Tax=Pseudorhodoferax sp. Leaf267 TaxID=1736316 RepID=UPI000701B49C|nr:AraC family transcriptional regulator [Pseudorhodoferax sp. Leaf267]KQP14227.1 AraC family transcriptional regulator [Pseudorhodoferax sp. Leaf267]
MASRHRSTPTIAPTHGMAATPMAFARVVAEAYARRGMSSAAALVAAQIQPQDLQIETASITARQFETLSAAAMQELDDEGLGAFRRRLPWGSYGMLARASLTAPTLGIALRRWCRHHGLLTDDIRLQLATAQGSATVRIEEAVDLAAHSSAQARAFCLLHVLRNLHGLACWYVESRIPLAGVAFPYPAPAHRAAVDLVFQQPAGGVRFGATAAELRFDARYLQLPIRRDERAMRQMLQRALPLIVLPWRRDRLLVQQVRQVLRERPEDARNASELAQLLATSARTLHRQLRDEGATLQGLKDEHRREHAQELLLRTRQPIKQVAARVGFRNKKSFARAFKNWTGQSPGQFRDAAGPSTHGP